MNKVQLLERSRSIGKDIVELMNEYRNSSGQVVEHDPEYYSEFFAGIINFLCTGNGELEFMYDSDMQNHFIDAKVRHTSNIHYPFHDDNIHDTKSVKEIKCNIKGKISKSYEIEMDPISYLSYVMTTPHMGTPLSEGVEIDEV